ncbi:MAG: CPBP family intramembrane metalloprotease [Flavobacteriales bacterium]|nr:CPBP family intramembrane metalloprotease [Flavobacteriales bacterium]MCC6937550.1 CPBP family intramembrane metalloprotease [Flavobacteriales bacterium]
MESPSAPEKSSVDPPVHDPSRPPALEFSMGVALFAMVIIVFFLVQAIALVHGIAARTPELADASFSFSWFEDPLFQQRLKDLGFNGDLVGMESAWSGGICTALILLVTWLWKRDRQTDLLGLRVPPIKHILKWGGLFMLMLLAIEGIARVFPVFDTDFMEQVVGSTTNFPLLVLGVVILGPLFEEFLLRGLLYGSLRHIVDENVSVALTAGVFALMHLQYSIPIMLLILPMGVVLGYARARSGSIWVPVLLHMANNGLSVLWP